LVSFRQILIVLFTIPMVYASTIALMWLVGIEFNVVTLTAIILALVEWNDYHHDSPRPNALCGWLSTDGFWSSDCYASFGFGRFVLYLDYGCSTVVALLFEH
jgi:hypothetical protein